MPEAAARKAQGMTITPTFMGWGYKTISRIKMTILYECARPFLYIFFEFEQVKFAQKRSISINFCKFIESVTSVLTGREFAITINKKKMLLNSMCSSCKVNDNF